jgi:type II secretory pathway pseudopilin PulG
VTTLSIVLLVITVILLAVLIFLYFWGKRAQKKKDEQDAQIASAAQTITMLVIDKKKLKLKDAGLPAQVLEQTPKLLRRSKVPIVKAKVGPKIMTFICDGQIFESVPLKKEIKAVVSGLYITGIKGLRGPIEAPVKKKGFLANIKDKLKK